MSRRPAEAIPPALQPPTVEHLQLTRRWTSAFRRLPDFLIIGAQKAGTSSLYAYLCAHPAVAPALAKEIHYFDYNYARGESWYRAHFPGIWEQWRKGYRATGEASPYYLFYPHAPRRAAALVPAARLIALLRNPADRAYSHYQHQVRLGLEPCTFEEALEQEAARLAGEYEKLIWDDTYYSFNYQNYSYRARGMYAGQLARWLSFFPREQLLVLPSDELYHSPARSLKRVLDFLGLPPWEPDFFRVENEGQYAPPDAATRRALGKWFAPHNATLYDMLHQDFGWE